MSFDTTYSAEIKLEDKIASQYDTIYDSLICYVERRKNFVKEIGKLVPDKNSKILDIGCGTGKLLEELERAGYTNLYGIDLSPQMIEAAKQNAPRTQFRVGFLEDTKYENNFFDLVIGTAVLHHVPQDHLSLVAQELSRILKPEGQLFFEESTEEWLFESGKPLTKTLVKLLFAPLLKITFWKNRKKINSLPQLTEESYSEHHRHLTKEEISQALKNKFAVSLYQKQVITPLFEGRLFMNSFDRAVFYYLACIEKIMEKIFPGFALYIKGKKLTSET